MYGNLKGRVGEDRRFFSIFIPQKWVLCVVNMDYTLTGKNSKITLYLLKKDACSGILAISTMLLGVILSLGHY